MSLNGKVTALLLTSDKESNFHHWRKTNVVELQKVLGDVANVMKTDGPAVDPETLRVLRTDAKKSRMRRQQELKKSHVPFYASLLSLLSPGSRDLVERHADYAANDLVMDPNVLWRIIKETHATNTTGTGKEQILANKVLMQMEFNDLRQGKTSIIELKELFMSKWTTLLSNGVHEVDEAELALMFLYRLDKGRYGQMMVDLANDALKGVSYPKTVMDTYVMAANRQEFTSVSASNSGMHTVYTLSEDKYHKSKAAGGRGKASGRGSGGRGRGRGGSGKGPVNSKAATTEPTSAPVSEGTSKGRGCYHCNDTKHIRANCPLLAKAAVCVVTSENECDEYDDYEDFDSTVAMFDDVNDSENKIAVFTFRETDVLLDSQGGRSVFKHQSLLHGVTLLERPYSLAGIDGSRSKGLSVKHCGYFRDHRLFRQSQRQCPVHG